MKDDRILMGVAGGSGSGKTTVTSVLKKRFGEHEVTVVEQDCYYRDQGELPLEKRRRTNYDHPEAFDAELLRTHIETLLQGRPIERPTYDFTEHRRLPETVTIQPTHVIILEGILILEDRALREMMDIKLFVDTDADVRIIRRLKRDMAERGRSLADVIDQYLETVRPMHLRFVEPTKRYADIIVPEGGFNRVAMDMLTAKIDFLLRRAGVRKDPS